MKPRTLNHSFCLKYRFRVVSTPSECATFDALVCFGHHIAVNLRDAQRISLDELTVLVKQFLFGPFCFHVTVTMRPIFLSKIYPWETNRHVPSVT